MDLYNARSLRMKSQNKHNIMKEFISFQGPMKEST